MNEDETEAKETMEGKVKVSSVQMHVDDNDLEANMKRPKKWPCAFTTGKRTWT